MRIATLIAFILVILGSLNWLMVGIFQYDLIAAVFGGASIIARAIYILVGLSSLWLASTMTSVYHVTRPSRV